MNAAVAVGLVVLALSVGAMLAVALCESLTRLRKVLLALLVVAIPGVGAVIALYLVVNARGVAPPSLPHELPSIEDVAITAATKVAHHIAEHEA